MLLALLALSQVEGLLAMPATAWPGGPALHCSGGQDPVDLKVEANRPVLVVGVKKTTITITTNYTGDILVQGVAGVQRVRAEEGKVVLADVKVDGDVIVTAGTKEERLRSIPGWVTLIPPILAILLAILTREVVVSLFAGIWAGSLIVLGLGFEEILLSALRSVDTVIVSELSKPTNIMVILFTVLLGAMVGVMTKSGGTKGVVDSVAKLAKTPRSSLIATWLMGVLIFFDDYANCLIIGNTMRPVTDRYKVSREKLAYIVDSTAAPVAAIAIISTWIVAEMGYIVSTGVITQQEMYSTFLAMIPYRFYCILTIFMVLVIAVSMRDFGPMLKAEVRAASTGQVIRPEGRPLVDAELREETQAGDMSDRWQNAAVPVLALIGVTMLALYLTGKKAAPDETRLFQIIGSADSYKSIIYGALAGLVLAVALPLARRQMKPGKTMEAAVAGAKAMFLALVILTLAWSIKKTCDEVSTGPWVVDQLGESMNLKWLPVIAFLLAAGISFATGTSWGTMAIMLPIVAPLAWNQPDMAIRLASLAAVLDGAVFGDHVSPISDTTIMSSMSTSCDHIDHVKTQSPYGLVTAGAALLLGYGLVGLGLVPALCLPIGAVAIVAVLFAVGKPVPVKAA